MVLWSSIASLAVGTAQMNPHPYRIANPPPGTPSVRTFRGEFFELYGPLEHTPYSRVSWHTQPVDLPNEIVKRFDGRVMAITGYEVDIVRVGANGTDESVPCFQQYNHHYSGWMHSSATQQVGTANASGSHGTPLPRWVRLGGRRYGTPTQHIQGVPHVQAFSEGNGNEHRRSYKSYPTGYAQLIQSPAVWANTPMIINVNKELTGETTPGNVASLQPRKSLAPRGAHAKYNGILECPCTTRKDKISERYELRAPSDGDARPCGGASAAVVETANECRAAATQVGVPPTSALTVVNSTREALGCWIQTDGRLFFNNATHRDAAYTTRQHDLCRDLRLNGGVVRPFSRSTPEYKFDAAVCAPPPLTSITPANNPICNFSWYGGGILCCGDGTDLLDADQPVPLRLDTWRLKYRFYFEDGTVEPEATVGRTTPRNLFRVWWSTEAVNNEYSVPQSTAQCLEPSTPAEDCTHTITSRFHGVDMLDYGRGCMVSGDPSACADVDRIRSSSGTFELVYAAAHCHAPACISMELWDADANTLVCRNEPTIGTGRDRVHDEEGFVVGIAPCVWGGHIDGLQSPPRIRLDGNYTSIKRVNSTNGHWGVMALWQCRGAYIE